MRPMRIGCGAAARQQAVVSFFFQSSTSSTLEIKMSRILKPVSLAVGAAFLGSLAFSASAATANGFAATDLAQGYMLVGEDKPAEGKCGADKDAEEGKDAEGKCGEGKCGADKDAAEEGKDAEGKCGADKEDADDGEKGEEGKCGAA